MSEAIAIRFAGRTVRDAAVTTAVTHPADVPVAELVAFFTDDHVHAALLVTSDGRLRAVVDRDDLPAAADGAAARFGRLDGRTMLPGEPLDAAYLRLLRSGRRRVAVIAADGRLVGLLCLKRDRTGFCTDRDVAARAAERQP